MKILYVVPYNFIPPNSGNKNLMFNLLKYVSLHSDCDLVMLADGDYDRNEIEKTIRNEYSKIGEVSIFRKQNTLIQFFARILCFFSGYHPALGRYTNHELKKWLSVTVNPKRYDVVHFDMVHMAPYRKFCKDVPSLLVASDAYSSAARKARNFSSSIKRRLRLLVEEWLIRNFEKNEYPHFNIVCTVSERDTEYLRAIVPNAVFRTVGIGVAPEYTDRKVLHLGSSAENQKNILCTGSLNHDIVADGIIEFLQKNLPSIRVSHPDVRVTVLGRNPVAELKRCIEETSGAEHVDFAPDYADFLDQDWVYVHPQRCGSGLQTKVQQAMALGLPVVGYDVSFGGLSVESGKNCYICNSNDNMTNYVLNLVGDGALRREIGSAAAKHMRENFSIKRVGSHMISLYHEAIAK